jgi:hypothetical protein
MYINVKCPIYSVLFCSFLCLASSFHLFFSFFFFPFLFLFFYQWFIFSVAVILVFFYYFSIGWSLSLNMISLPEWSIKKQKILNTKKSTQERTNINNSHFPVFSRYPQNIFSKNFFSSNVVDFVNIRLDISL